MKTNLKAVNTRKTHEGAPAVPINAEKELRRSVMACLLWENTFYESGVEIAQRIASLVPTVGVDKCYQIAVEARNRQKLRHAPLWIARAMARLKNNGLSTLLPQIIQRADELTEFVAMYWKDKKQPLSAQVKRGLATAFTRFDAYQLAKYNRDEAVKLRDVLFLSHAKPLNNEMAAMWKQLIDGTLPVPDTWEVALSTGKDKKETWVRLMAEGKLGALALLRNLRNMQEVGVPDLNIVDALGKAKVDKVLPFRFISAARYAPKYEPALEAAMFRCLEGKPKLKGKTILLVDVSGSMDSPISDRSEVTGMDAACGVGMILRELCDEVEIHSFSDFNRLIPPRRGFALRDAIVNSMPHGGTNLGAAVNRMNGITNDRLIVITDEQAHDTVGAPAGKGYMVNVRTYKNGVGYGKWVHIDGFSEAVVDYIREYEAL